MINPVYMKSRLFGTAVVEIMNRNNTLILVLCTCPDGQVAEKIAEFLVTEKLAACVNILPGIRSIFSWRGKIENEKEQLLVIKSIEQNYAALESAIKTQHPYEVPEIIAAPITLGSAEYINWIQESICKN